MRPFSSRLFSNAEFAAAVWPAKRDTSVPANRRGNARPTYPAAGLGVTVLASVQPGTMRRIDPDGNVLTTTCFDVFLRSDPSALNASAGVREGDAFRQSGRMFVAQGPAEPPGAGNCTWKVPCLDVE